MANHKTGTTSVLLGLPVAIKYRPVFHSSQARSRSRARFSPFAPLELPRIPTHKLDLFPTSFHNLLVNLIQTRIFHTTTASQKALLKIPIALVITHLSAFPLSCGNGACSFAPLLRARSNKRSPWLVSLRFLKNFFPQNLSFQPRSHLHHTYIC